MTIPKTAKRLNRILAMLPWVIGHPGTTVEEVSDRFGYTHKELLADLDLVFVCGLPGYGPGDLMEAYVEGDKAVVDLADYFSRPLRLSPAEALGLMAAAMALASTGQAPPALERALEKLAAAILPDASDALVVELGAEPDVLDVLRQAAGDHVVVNISYMALGTNEMSTRDVEPWTVFSSLGNWYLSGFCRLKAGERIFRVDRIREVETVDATFVPPDEVPEPVVRFTPSEDDTYATISLGRRARWVAEYYPVEIIEDAPDALIVRFAASDPLVAARLLVRLGSSAQLLEGEAVQSAVAHLRSIILQRYG